MKNWEKKLTNRELARHWEQMAYGDWGDISEEEVDDALDRVTRLYDDNTIWVLKTLSVSDIEGHHEGHDSSEQYIQEYVDRKSQGSDFPPLIVEEDEDHPGKYKTIDGQHRLLAAKRLGQTTIDAYVPEDLVTAGKAGDWKEEGFTFKVQPDGPKGALIVCEDKDGNTRGILDVRVSETQKDFLFPVNVNVLPQDQRKGIATELYRLAEEHFGKKFLKEGKFSRTGEGKAFRKAYDKTTVKAEGETSFLPDKLVMLDLEMTGVIPKRDDILQIAAIKLELQGNQYVEIEKPLVVYLHHAGSPENDFQKKFLSEIFKLCNESEVTPEDAKKALEGWLGDWWGKVTPVGDCVPTDIAFLLEKGIITSPDIGDDGQIPSTFHYEFFDLNSVKAFARQKLGEKFEIPGADLVGIHDGLVDCRNQLLELNLYLEILLGEDEYVANSKLIEGAKKQNERSQKQNEDFLSFLDSAGKGYFSEKYLLSPEADDRWVEQQEFDADAGVEQTREEWAKEQQEFHQQSGDPSMVFGPAKKVKSTDWLIHFTKANPFEIIENGFKGRELDIIGLTTHYKEGSYPGSLALAYKLEDIPPAYRASEFGKYGKNAIIFKVKEGARAYHYSDEEHQVVFTASTAYSMYPVFDDGGDMLELYDPKKKQSVVKVERSHEGLEQIMNRIKTKNMKPEDEELVASSLVEAGFKEFQKEYLEVYEKSSHELADRWLEDARNTRDDSGIDDIIDNDEGDEGRDDKIHEWISGSLEQQLSRMKKSMKFKGDRLIVYRMMKIGSFKKLDLESLGLFWTYKPNTAIAYWGGKGKAVLVKATVALKDVDFYETLSANSHANHFDEDEITLKKGAELRDVEVVTEGKTERHKQAVAGSDSYVFNIKAVDGVMGNGLTMYRSYNPKVQDPVAPSKGQYGTGHYLAPSKDAARYFSDKGHTIGEFQVKHPKVLEIHELGDPDDDGAEMFRAAKEFTNIKAKNWDEFNKKLKAQGFGGIEFYYGDLMGEFLGFGNHLLDYTESSVEAGASGDWEKEGYELKFVQGDRSIFQFAYSKGVNNIRGEVAVFALKDGKLVGWSQFLERGERGYSVLNVEIKPEHQRKGLASAMYRLVETTTGTKVIPGAAQTDEAKELWKQTKRGFGVAAAGGIEWQEVYREYARLEYAKDGHEVDPDYHPDYELKPNRGSFSRDSRDFEGYEWERDQSFPISKLSVEKRPMTEPIWSEGYKKPEEDFDLEKMKAIQKKKYRDLSQDEVAFDTAWADEMAARDFAKKKTKAPPIVVVWDEKKNRYKFWNGRHRARAAALRGETTIDAFVGTPSEDTVKPKAAAARIKSDTLVEELPVQVQPVETDDGKLSAEKRQAVEGFQRNALRADSFQDFQALLNLVMLEVQLTEEFRPSVAGILNEHRVAEGYVAL